MLIPDEEVLKALGILSIINIGACVNQLSGSSFLENRSNVSIEMPLTDTTCRPACPLSGFLGRGAGYREKLR